MAFSSELFDLAQRYQKSGDLQHAERLFRQILKANPTQANVHAHLGDTLQGGDRWREAVVCFREALRLDPFFADAHYCLGSVLMNHGKVAEAVVCFRLALSVNPQHENANCDLGLSLAHQGKLLEATQWFRQALAINPHNADAHNNLGRALHGQGKLTDAAACFRKALCLNPRAADAHYNLGNVLKDHGRFAKAAECLRQALRINPHHADARNNLGTVLFELGQVAEAAESFRQALTINPNHADACNNLGIALFELGQLAEAARSFRQALRIHPNQVEAHFNLGNILFEQGQFSGAADCYRQALRINPNHADAYFNLGNAQNQQGGQLDDVIECYRQALHINPKHVEAHNNLANVYKDQGRLEEAIIGFRNALEVKPDYSAAHSNLICSLQFQPAHEPLAILEECRRWQARHAEPLAKSIKPHGNDKSPERRLRIGYVSPDLCAHPVGRFLLPLLQAHDHARHEIFCYSSVKKPDTLTQRCQAQADGWRPIFGSSADEVAELIRRDQIDILVDLAMHSRNNHLLVFARKPAPIQVSYLAYCGTTGLGAMDYRLTDPYLDPPGLSVRFYTEQSIRLPDTFWCYQPVPEAPMLTPLPSLKTGHITFGCLNNFCKVTQPTLETWAFLLQSIPDARLLVYAQAGSHRERVRDIFARRGLSADRVSFVDRMPMAEYFRTYERIDVALDPFPSGGGTTTCDALWMGVPAVSLIGQTAAGRGGVSILSNIKLTDLLASDAHQYVRIAKALAGDRWRLIELRATLRARMQSSPLMDAPRFARNVEEAYRSMWRTWCVQKGKPRDNMAATAAPGSRLPTLPPSALGAGLPALGAGLPTPPLS